MSSLAFLQNHHRPVEWYAQVYWKLMKTVVTAESLQWHSQLVAVLLDSVKVSKHFQGS